MKTTWVKRCHRGLLVLGLIGAGMAFVGCADEYAAYPGYRGGYYASYSAPYPYSGYGSGYGYPYRAYGPYYGGGPYYGYGSPYYGGASVVVSRSSSYTYRDRYGRVHTRRNANRLRNGTTRAARTPATQIPNYQSDEESRYYPRPR